MEVHIKITSSSVEGCEVEQIKENFKVLHLSVKLEGRQNFIEFGERTFQIQEVP